MLPKAQQNANKRYIRDKRNKGALRKQLASYLHLNDVLFTINEKQKAIFLPAYRNGAIILISFYFFSSRFRYFEFETTGAHMYTRLVVRVFEQ